MRLEREEVVKRGDSIDSTGRQFELIGNEQEQILFQIPEKLLRLVQKLDQGVVLELVLFHLHFKDFEALVTTGMFKHGMEPPPLPVSATPDHGAQTAAQAEASPLGSVALDNAQESLAKLENPVDNLPTRNRHWLAARRIQDVLAMEVQAPAWATCKGPGTDSTHRPDVERQPNLGQSAHPRRTGEAGSAGFDGHDPKVSPQVRTPTVTKLADLSPEPRWCHCRDGFLCGSDGDLPPSLCVGRHES
jgi:hypothetical protein